MSLRDKLVLGSSSPYRKELLGRLNLEFTTDSPSIDETPLAGESPAELALRLSVLKAKAVAKKHQGSVVIGSDQVLDLDGECLGKPGNRENAIKQLERTSGKKLIFQTALTVIDANGRIQSALVPTTITMRKLNRATIEKYVDLEQPFNCAGAAKIEKLGIAIIEEFSSTDPTAIIGLPLIKLVEMLTKAGIEVLPEIESK